MAIYTVHEPPRRGSDPLAHAGRFIFIRDGFSWVAFLLAPLWMLRHRLWIGLLLYIAAAAAIGVAWYFLRPPEAAVFWVILLLSVLVGLEASSLRRWTLERARWTNAGVVVGHDIELAERRFFDAWIRDASPSRADHGRPAVGTSAASSDIVGLFPEPAGRS